MAAKDLVKGICSTSKCNYDVYTKDKIDELLATVNETLEDKAVYHTIDSATFDFNSATEVGIYIFANDYDAEDLTNAPSLSKIEKGSILEVRTFGYAVDATVYTASKQILKYNCNESYTTFERDNESSPTWKSWEAHTKEAVSGGTSNPTGGNDGDIYFQYEA